MNALLATTFSTLVFHIHFVCLNELGTCWPWVDGIFYSATKCLDRVNFSRLMFFIIIASISVGCLLASSGSIMDDGKRLSVEFGLFIGRRIFRFHSNIESLFRLLELFFPDGQLTAGISM